MTVAKTEFTALPPSRRAIRPEFAGTARGSEA
jgi:hypothetical protein